MPAWKMNIAAAVIVEVKVVGVYTNKQFSAKLEVGVSLYRVNPSTWGFVLRSLSEKPVLFYRIVVYSNCLCHNNNNNNKQCTKIFEQVSHLQCSVIQRTAKPIRIYSSRSNVFIHSTRVRGHICKNEGLLCSNKKSAITIALEMERGIRNRPSVL